MKYAVILKRRKKNNVTSTKRLTFFSLDDAAHYERQIKQHDPKVISTELIPVFSWKQSSMHWTKNSPFISIRRGKVSIGTMMVLICPTDLSAAINRRLMTQNCTLSTVQRQKRTFETHFGLFLTHFSRNAHYWESITCFYWELKNVLKNRFAWARRRLWRYLRGSLEYLCCLRPQPQKSQAPQWHFENWHRLPPFWKCCSYNY